MTIQRTMFTALAAAAFMLALALSPITRTSSLIDPARRHRIGGGMLVGAAR